MGKFTAIAAFVSLSISLVSAQGLGYTPLREKRFEYNQLRSSTNHSPSQPYRIDTDVGLSRGEQAGYNICNRTTAGPDSMCQTAMINSLDDFCFWAPPEPGSDVGSIEGKMVAWCTRPDRGARVILDGTITGVQFTKAPDYIQVSGFMDQTKINMLEGDMGGEMDPHGEDLRGNPLGGILYSNAWTGSLVQVLEWHNFMGNNYFCLKACDPAGANDARYCEHIFDTRGCVFNAPSNARDGVFESCASDNQPFPGEGEPIPPQSSLCSTYASTDIYGPSATVRVPIPGAETMSFAPLPSHAPATTDTPPPAQTSPAATSPRASGANASNTSGGNVPAQTGASGSSEEDPNDSAVSRGASVVAATLAAALGAYVLA